jgi:hypothetical protein
MTTEPSVVRLWESDAPGAFAGLFKVGNQASNQYWEFLLPSDFDRPSREEAPRLGCFIQDKYVVARWADPDRHPPLDFAGKKLRGRPDIADLSLDLAWCREDLDLPGSVRPGFQGDGPYLGIDPEIATIFGPYSAIDGTARYASGFVRSFNLKS